MNAPIITTSKPLSTKEMEEIADRIRQRTAQAIIENGQDLLKAKAALPHGEFTAWLQHSVDMSERTAQRCMQVAEWVGTLPEGKSDTVSVLAPKQLYLLSAPSTPGDAQERVLGMVSRGIKVGHAETFSIVNQARRRETKAAAEARDAAYGTGISASVDGKDADAELLPPEPERWSSKRGRLLNEAAEDLALTLHVILKNPLAALNSDEAQIVHRKLTAAAKDLRSVRSRVLKRSR